MKCLCCKKKFDPSHGNKKYCCDKCHKEHLKRIRKPYEETLYLEKKYTAMGLRCYFNILARCNNPNNPSYYRYGGNGIKCLLTKEEFMKIFFSTETCENCGVKLNDKNRKLKDGRTLDRIAAGGNYELGNLRVVCRSCNSYFVLNKRKIIN
jgi:hypothetical protein